MATAVETLPVAKQILLVDGWTVGEWKCSDGRHCAAGALRAAHGINAQDRSVTTNGKPVSQQRRKDYLAAISILAEAIEPGWEARYRKQYAKGCGNDHCCPPGSTTVSIDDLLNAAEAIVYDYNDERVNNSRGRAAVLKRFDKAINLASQQA